MSPKLFVEIKLTKIIWLYLSAGSSEQNVCYENSGWKGTDSTCANDVHMRWWVCRNACSAWRHPHHRNIFAFIMPIEFNCCYTDGLQHVVAHISLIGCTNTLTHSVRSPMHASRRLHRGELSSARPTIALKATRTPCCVCVCASVNNCPMNSSRGVSVLVALRSACIETFLLFVHNNCVYYGKTAHECRARGACACDARSVEAWRRIACTGLKGMPSLVPGHFVPPILWCSATSSRLRRQVGWKLKNSQVFIQNFDWSRYFEVLQLLFFEDRLFWGGVFITFLEFWANLWNLPIFDWNFSIAIFQCPFPKKILAISSRIQPFSKNPLLVSQSYHSIDPCSARNQIR